MLGAGAGCARGGDVPVLGAGAGCWCWMLVLAVRMVETGGAGCARGGDSVWKAGVLHGS